MTRLSLRTLGALLFLAAFALQATDLPAWRDTTPATRFLGPDRFWRCRDTLVFNLHDEAGTGFRLDIDVRDMNIYLQGPRPTLLWVTGPQGRTVARQVLDDDGIVEGNQQYHDGVPDMYGDIRYRAWHRHNSPGGYPPGKARAPQLADPGSVAARTVTLNVPPAGPGLYRLVVIGTWDNWISVTPSRPLPAAISPGPAPLYLHGVQLDDSWIYAPANVQEAGFSITEEVQPWSWTCRILDEAGTQVGLIAPKGQLNYALIQPAKPDSLYHLRLTAGSPGACLHSAGIPLLLCPDAATARLFHGGMEIDAKGRVTWHQHQRVLNDWVDSLNPADLAVDVQPPADNLQFRVGNMPFVLNDIPLILAAQELDPAADNYGDFNKTGNGGLDKKLNGFWLPGALVLAYAAGFDDPGNPWYGNQAVIRRVMLFLVNKRFSTQSAWFWFQPGDAPTTFTVKADSFWGLPFRSNWYPLQDAQFAVTLGPIRDQLKYALPPTVNDAWRQAVRSWAIGRYTEQQGECTNQWAKGLEALVNIWFATRDYDVEQVMRFQSEYIATPGVLGRVNPDPDPWCTRGKVGFGWAADSGIIGGAIASENFGHDGEYNLETVSHLSHIQSLLPDPKLLTWLNDYYVLKTHLSLPKGGDWPPNSFSGTCSPSDTNFRTRYYTHKSGLSGLEHEVKYGDIWAGEKNLDTPWPALEEKPFLRTIDDRYVFLRTPSYYTILYTAYAGAWYTNWGQAKVSDGTVDWIGYSGMHYGGLGYKAPKPSAISALWVNGCGPVLCAQNHNVMFTENVWGHLAKPICQGWQEGDVDATVVAECYNQPVTNFDPKTRVLDRSVDLRYVPLTVKRQATFADDRVNMTVTITATDAVEFVSLYECLPVYTQDRQLSLYDDAFAPLPYQQPEAVTTESNPHTAPPPLHRGENPDLPKVTFRAVDVTAKSGAGALVVLDQTRTAMQTQPIRYRSVAAATGGFNLELPTKWQKGQTVTLSYSFIPHANGLNATQLKQLATP